MINSTGAFTFATILAAAALLSISCSKPAEMPATDHPTQDAAKKLSGGLTTGDTILQLTYENNLTNSGVTGVNPTGASAPDAVYMVSPGATDNYGVAHKSTLGDAGYYSFGAYRSESDAVGVKKFQFFPGEHRRYEASILLKDWELWNSANPPYGDNIFQLKVSDDQGEPLRVVVKRNAIVTRRYNTYQENLVTDFRPYINQWINSG